jgi:hypothetical protein
MDSTSPIKTEKEDSKKVTTIQKVESKTELKIPSLRRIPPKRGSTMDSLRPSLTRFQLDTPSKVEEVPDIKPNVPLPSFVFKSNISGNTSTDTSTKPSTLSTKPSTLSTKPIFKPSPVLVKHSPKKAEHRFSLIDDLSSEEEEEEQEELIEIQHDDLCTQYNFFILSKLSCFIDSLLFSLLHKFDNNFIEDIKRAFTLKDESIESCKKRTIDAIISFYNDIHDKTRPFRRLHSRQFRELLYECDTPRQSSKIAKNVYTSTQQDPHDFFGKILNIIQPTECIYYLIKEYSNPRGNAQLLDNFREYKTDTPLNTYNSILIYPANEESKVIDVGFRQIDDNTFAFITPKENIIFERATWEYENIVEFIHKNNLVDRNIIERIQEYDPQLLDFFKPDIDHKNLIDLYKGIYNAHNIVFSEELGKEIIHYKYREDLPKLTYTKSSLSTIFRNPLNYFVISIARENIDLRTKNKFNLINLPERIRSYDKTLELVSAVVHYGHSLKQGHYVCYFKCNNHWYVMDNFVNNITKYAPFDIRNTEIMSQCRLLIYM